MKMLSQRDGAFLTEMGIAPVWRLRHPVLAEVPVAEVPVAEVPVAEAPVAEVLDGSVPAANGPAVVAPAADAPAATGPVEARDAGLAGHSGEADIASMDWPALRAAIASCERCGACRPGAQPVYGAGAETALWLVAAGATSVADEQARLPVAGEAGILLDHMLAAVGHARERDVYVTNLVKCRPSSPNGGDRAPSADEVAACRPFLERELALSGAGVLLTLGQVAANAMLGKPLQDALAGARGQIHAVAGAAMVATLHPAELLRRGADKALAWADLCRARGAAVDVDLDVDLGADAVVDVDPGDGANP